ncbi:unnamed protein product [Rotaria sp. Silwood2]|nr:unnamed protein product [Rotaria sp. Silwood2]
MIGRDYNTNPTPITAAAEVLYAFDMVMQGTQSTAVIVIGSSSTNQQQHDQQDSCIVVDGINWFYYWDIETLRFGLNYQARSDDLFIVTYPKSGTTWMKTIVYTLLTNGQPFDLDNKDFFERFPYLELDDEQAIITMRRPGALRSHLPMNRIPYNSQAKYICVIRNPKDVCVSYYAFYNTWGGVHRLNFNEFFERFIQGRLPFNDYFECLQLTWERRNDANALLVSYEEMKSDIQTVIQKNEDPKPPKKVQELQTEISQLNIEWGQAFKDQLEENQKLKEKHLQDIKDIVELLIFRMITRIESDVGGEKRELLPDIIYCEKVSDLLNNKKRLRVLEDQKNLVQVCDRKEQQVKSVQDVLNIIQHGMSIRTSGTTAANSNSS